MKHGFVQLALIVLLAGCVSPPPAPAERPTVSSSDFEALWQATRDAAERHFEIYVQRKDMGYLASTYERAEPIPHLFHREARTAYDTLEDFMHVVRRRLVARIIEDRPGVYFVHLEVTRERQGYVPPPTWHSSGYNLYDSSKSLLNDVADQGDTVTWYPLGRDLWFENALLSEIDRRLGP